MICVMMIFSITGLFSGRFRADCETFMLTNVSVVRNKSGTHMHIH